MMLSQMSHDQINEIELYVEHNSTTTEEAGGIGARHLSYGGIGDTCRMEELETPVVHLSKEFASSASHNYYKPMRELCICLQKTVYNYRSLQNPCNRTWH